MLEELGKKEAKFLSFLSYVERHRRELSQRKYHKVSIEMIWNWISKEKYTFILFYLEILRS